MRESMSDGSIESIAEKVLLLKGKVFNQELLREAMSTPQHLNV